MRLTLFVVMTLLLYTIHGNAEKCYSAQEVNNKLCWVACRNDGYDTGSYAPKKDACLCAHVRKFSEITESRIIIHATQPHLKEQPMLPQSHTSGFRFKFLPDDDDDN